MLAPEIRMFRFLRTVSLLIFFTCFGYYVNLGYSILTHLHPEPGAMVAKAADDLDHGGNTRQSPCARTASASARPKPVEHPVMNHTCDDVGTIVFPICFSNPPEFRLSGKLFHCFSNVSRLFNLL